MPGYWEDSTFEAWADHVREELVPMVRDSAVTISLVPSGGIDVKFAVELGLSIMMDKPIIALVSPGTHVPDALARVADEIVEVDVRNPNASQRSITEAFGRVMRRRAAHISLDEVDND